MAFPKAAGAGSYSNNILSIHDEIIKPDFLMQAYEEHGGQFHTFMNILEMTGSHFPVKLGGNKSYKAFFNGWKTFYVTVNANVADPGVGNSVTITLSHDDHTNNGTRSYPRMGWGTLIPGTGAAPVEARIMTKDTSTNYAHTITLMPKKSTDNIGAISAGTRLFMTSPAKPYGTGQGVGVNTTEITREYFTQIFEENWGSDGDMLVQPTWVKIRNDGDELKGITAKELGDLEFRLDKGRGMAMWLGSEIDNPNMVMNATEAAYRDSSSKVGAGIQSTKGIWRWIYELGKTTTIASGAMVWDDMRDIKSHLISEATNAKQAAIVGGYARTQEIIDLVFDRNQGNGTDYTSKNVIAPMLKQRSSMGFRVREGWNAYFDFHSFTDSGITYLITEIADFSDPRTLGLSEFGWDNYAAIFPMGTVLASANSNEKKDRLLPTVGMAYVANMGYSRRLETWRTGAANGVYTNKQDEWNFHKRCQEGAFVANANQGYLIVT